MHVNPVGALCCGSVPALCGSSGPADKKVRLRTGQLCLGSYFSVTEGADQEPPPQKNTIPANPPFHGCARPGNPSRAPTAASKPGHRRCRLCLSLSRPAKSFSSSSSCHQPPQPHLHSAPSQPRASLCHLARRLGSVLSLCVCVSTVRMCVFTSKGVPLARCCGVCLRFCVRIVRVGVFRRAVYMHVWYERVCVCVCLIPGALL